MPGARGPTGATADPDATAAGSLGDRVDGLSIGADDYLAKPFAFVELVGRVRALVRRPSAAHAPVIVRGDITLDPGRRIPARGGQPVHLTRKEFGVLQKILEAGGAVVSAEELLEHVWDENTDPFTNVVRVAIMSLRKKLGEPPVIETVVGSGYRACV